MTLRVGVVAGALALLACAPVPPSQDAEFVALADQYVESLLARYPEFATSLGDHRYDTRLNDYSAAAIAADIAWNQGYLDQANGIDPARLSPVNTVDFEILRNHLRFSIWSDEVLREHEWNPLRYGVGNALYSLLAREFAPIEDRLANLRERLLGVGAVVEAAKANLSNPPRVHTETAIRQNAGTISLIREDLDGILARVPQMADSLAPAREFASRTLEAYGTWLRDDLLPRSKGSFRIGPRSIAPSWRSRCSRISQWKRFSTGPSRGWRSFMTSFMKRRSPCIARCIPTRPDHEPQGSRPGRPGRVGQLAPNRRLDRRGRKT